MTIQAFMEMMSKNNRFQTVERYRRLNQHCIKGEALFAGSSLAEQFPVNEMLMSRGITTPLYNRGVSGDTIEQLLKDRQTLIYDLEPSKLFINIGSNNIGGEHYDPDKLFDQYTNLLKEIQNKLPDCRIHVLAYYPVNPDKPSHIPKKDRDNMFLNRTNENIQSMNQRLRVFCQENGFVYIDVNSPLLDEHNKLIESFTIEGIHMWPDAYEKVLDVLVPYIQ